MLTGAIELGFVALRDEDELNLIDATTSTLPGAPNRLKSNLIMPIYVSDGDPAFDDGAVLAKGLLNAGTARWKDGTRRSEIDQERIKAGRQLTAAWCNEALFGSEFDYFYLGWDVIQAIMLGDTCLDGTELIACTGTNGKPDLDLIIASINAVGGVADMFNNSGDALPNGFPSSSANPHAPEDDPTDPTD